MPFQITNESVTLMRDLARKIPNSVESLQQANNSVISCYNDVKSTVGPHTCKIESIVNELNKMLKKSSDSISEIPHRLNELADKCEEIINANPRKRFLEGLRVDNTPTVTGLCHNNSNNMNASRGQRERSIFNGER